MAAPITTDSVWREVEKQTFAVLSWVIPKGEARSAGIIYLVRDRTLFIGTGASSWKAKQISHNPAVALNVLIQKRIPLLPWIKIPDATIAFRGQASVRAFSEVDPSIYKELTKGMADDPEIHADTCILVIEPEGHFVTYGVGVPLLDMRDPRKAEGRAPV
ncbi:MAG: pyridoxamine 5'-phosphate oxidase family protein [Myxococcota bacterium]